MQLSLRVLVIFTKVRLIFLDLPMPTVLVVYKSNHKDHTSAVHEIAEYLREKNMKVLLYDQEISRRPGQVLKQIFLSISSI